MTWGSGDGATFIETARSCRYVESDNLGDREMESDMATDREMESDIV